MLAKKVVGIVIHSKDYKENDKIITLCTLEQGKISACLKGCKKPKAKLKFASSPLCFGEFMILEGKLNTVIEVNLYESFFTLTSNIHKFYLAMAVMELLGAFVAEQAPASDAVYVAVDFLKELAFEETNYKLKFIEAFLKLFSIFGYGLSFNSCQICGNTTINGVGLKEGGGVCASHISLADYSLSKPAIMVLQNINNVKLEMIEGLLKPLSAGECDKTLSEIMFILRHYYYLLTERKNNALKSFFSI